MPKLTVDGIEVEVPGGATVLQACEMAGIEIPRFCYHERLSIAGSCRMCLVEQEKAPKPIASCAMPAAEGMVIHTDTPRVRKAREGVMELLLINHPLDCPICDQGGECDLQDQAMAYGKGGSRFEENKRAVGEKYMGPLIKTIMTRCIHCTRCVRFAEEVAGVEEIGAIFRGENMQITTYLERAASSELSANVIDLCPVGALTSKPYAFEARPWELKKTESIDVMDAVGSNIRVDSRGPEVMRVLPRLNEDVNEEWLADRSRYACDGLLRRRLDRPWVRRDGALREASWSDAFTAVKQGLAGLSGAQIGAVAGDLADVEAVVALKDLLGKLGSNLHECRVDGAALDPAQRGAYLFNTTIAGIEQADVCVLAGTNPRNDAPILAARIRKAVRKRGLKVFVLGPALDLTYAHTHLGPDARRLSTLDDVFRDAKAPMLVLGMDVLARADGAAILAEARALADRCGLVRDGWNGFNVLHKAAGRVGALDAGFVHADGLAGLAGVRALFNLGADEMPADAFGGAFRIYIGSHGDRGAHGADVILPAAAYTEKDATYVNTEGRVQRTLKAVFAPGEAREDWTIFRALSDVLGLRLPYDSLDALRGRIAGEWSHLAGPGLTTATWGAFGRPGFISDQPIALDGVDHYQTNPVMRASQTLAECSAVRAANEEQATGTHG